MIPKTLWPLRAASFTKRQGSIRTLPMCLCPAYDFARASLFTRGRSSVTRDISILIADTLASATVRATVRAAAPDTLVRVREFDRYQGKGVPEGKVSLSLRLVFRASDRTLTDTEVQSAMDAVLAALKNRHNAIQR